MLSFKGPSVTLILQFPDNSAITYYDRQEVSQESLVEPHGLMDDPDWLYVSSWPAEALPNRTYMIDGGIEGCLS
jgi:hypothetical protein